MGHSSLLTADKHEMAICSIYLPSHYLDAQPVWSWVPGPGPAKALPLNIISISLVTRGAHTGPCHKSIQLWTCGAGGQVTWPHQTATPRYLALLSASSVYWMLAPFLFLMKLPHLPSSSTKIVRTFKFSFDGRVFVSLLVFIVRTVRRGHLGRRADEHLSTVRVAMQTTSSLCYHWPSSCYKNVWRLRHHKALLSNDRPQSLDTHSTYMRDWQIVPKMLDILLRKPLYVYNYEYPSNRFML